MIAISNAALRLAAQGMTSERRAIAARPLLRQVEPIAREQPEDVDECISADVARSLAALSLHAPVRARHRRLWSWS